MNPYFECKVKKGSETREEVLFTVYTVMCLQSRPICNINLALYWLRTSLTG